MIELHERNWTWADGSPFSRAEMVRRHDRGSLKLSDENLRDLFCLTEFGLNEIRRGASWRPEFSTPTS